MSQLSLLNNRYGNNNTRMYFVCKKRDCQLTRYTKEECNEVKKGFKRRVHQYFADNNINDDFNKDIIAIILNILTPTTTSGNFFYNDYGVEHFITLDRLILIKTAKNIVIFINNNTYVYGLTSSTEPGSTEPSTAKSNNKGKNTTYFYNNNNDDVNIENFTVNINFLNCYFNNDRQDYKCLVISFSTSFPLQSAIAL